MPFVGYTVASAQQLSGQVLFNSFSDEYSYDTPKNDQLQPTRDSKQLMSESLTDQSKRIIPQRLGTGIATKISFRRPKLLESNMKLVKEMNLDDDMTLLLNQTSDDNKDSEWTQDIQSNTKSPQNSTKMVSVKFFKDDTSKRPRLCASKCFHGWRRRVHIQKSMKLDTKSVDSLSSSFSGRIKSLMMIYDTFDSNLNYKLSLLECFSQPFVDTCITDNNIAGQVIKLQSREFTVSTASVRIGECNFFNLSPTYQTNQIQYPLKVASPGSVYQDPRRTLRIETGTDGRPRFLLTFWGELHSLSESKCRLGWISNIDITDIIRKLAITEYYSHISGLVLGSDTFTLWRHLHHQKKNAVSSHSSQNTQQNSKTTNISSINKNGRTLFEDVLSKEQLPECQELILSMISQLRVYHSSILVFSSESISTDTSFRLRFVSENLFKSREDLTHNISKMNKKDLEKLGEVLSSSKNTTTIILWGKKAEKMRLYCVPVMEHRHSEIKAWPKWWVCFMVDASLESLWK